ncbi:Histone-lysine N-methyltransferase SETMAR [Eumeta japonica]|uniref:Histone-lysine N-methyltransferase SETMAR n=1 Tax=Eumeta variegata TaxID=151549 RepID=A0A4C1XKM8_EUMVA|nr:Histone-lysine N-methyltransferase SETMAR [Eumeta japonica]
MMQRFAGDDSNSVYDVFGKNDPAAYCGDVDMIENPVLHQDNVSQHTARQTINYLGRLGIKILVHPPKNPALVPCDFYLFSKIKGKLRGKWFTDAEETVAAYEKAVEATI